MADDRSGSLLADAALTADDWLAGAFESPAEPEPAAADLTADLVAAAEPADIVLSADDWLSGLDTGPVDFLPPEEPVQREEPVVRHAPPVERTRVVEPVETTDLKLAESGDVVDTGHTPKLKPAGPKGPQPPKKGGPSRAAEPEGKKKKSRTATVLLAFGVAWLAAGLGMLGWVAYELWGTNIGVREGYVSTIDELENEWNNPAEAEAVEGEGGEDVAETVTSGQMTYNLGAGFAILDIPQLSLRAPILVGTEESALSRGIGWMEWTAAPGELGNTVLAGHHSSRGHPFDNLQTLQKGDRFTIETATMIYTYEMLNSPADITVDFTETWVTMPDPINRTNDATHYYLTLLTCKEYFSTPQRSIGFAELVSAVAK
jgi:sortase A